MMVIGVDTTSASFDKSILLCLNLVAVITAPVRGRHQPGPALVAPPAAGLGAELRGVAAPRTAAE